jgi:hypothetical protein
MKALQKIPDGNQDPYEKILRTPSVLMMFGVELLMISVILLAAKALSREVWISCTVVVAACMCGPLASLYKHSRFSMHYFIVWLNKPSPVFYMEGSDFGNQFYAWKDRQAAPGV